MEEPNHAGPPTTKRRRLDPEDDFAPTGHPQTPPYKGGSPPVQVSSHPQNDPSPAVHNSMQPTTTFSVPSPSQEYWRNGQLDYNDHPVPTQSTGKVAPSPFVWLNPPPPSDRCADNIFSADEGYPFSSGQPAVHVTNDTMFFPSRGLGRPVYQTPQEEISQVDRSPSSSRGRNSVSLTATMDNGGHRYQPLHEHGFRLIRLLPERRTRVNCELIHMSFANYPSYVAVSYAWGDPGETRNIELNGILVPVSISVHGALVALRHKSEASLVWIDAICIDQSNKDEQARQVRLMTDIYSKAEFVAIWLGPEADDSACGLDLLCAVAEKADNAKEVSRLLLSPNGKAGIFAIVSLFERDYWRRLWVVQEILNARTITVCCGQRKIDWTTFKMASQAFGRHRQDLDLVFSTTTKDTNLHIASSYLFSSTQVLVYQGPGSIPELKSYVSRGEDALLQVLRACRRKLCAQPRDKLYGVLGILPESTRKDFSIDYTLSVKSVYSAIVDNLIKTTDRLDVICDAIHFPPFTSPANLPSFVPDWSHITHVAAMSHKYNFQAAGNSEAKCHFLDDSLNKLEISAIHLDVIAINGIAVGTQCTLADYLMAFLHWHALLLKTIAGAESIETQQNFCKTISLNQVSQEWPDFDQWLDVTYHVFASLLRERLPHLPLTSELQKYVDTDIDLNSKARRQFLQKHFGDRMMSRSFCMTEGGLMGMGTGFMLPGDIAVVPFGCSTPVLLRQEGMHGEYRFVGDVYIHGYMDGLAVTEWEQGKREEKRYVLH